MKGSTVLNAGVWEELPIGISETTESLENFEDKTPANTDSGFYRLISGIWEQVPIESVNAIHSLVVSKNDLYVGMGPDLSIEVGEIDEIGISGIRRNGGYKLGAGQNFSLSRCGGIMD